MVESDGEGLSERWIMTIGKKPKALEKQALDFITKAEKKDDQPYAITLRLDREFLDLIDAKAKELRITRSAWIKSVLSQALD